MRDGSPEGLPRFASLTSAAGSKKARPGPTKQLPGAFTTSCRKPTR
jgi:hypothetical protein